MSSDFEVDDSMGSVYNDDMTNTESTTRKRLAVDVANDLMLAGDATYRALVDLTEHDDHDTAVAASVALDAYLTAWAEAWVATADRMGYDAMATHCDATADEWCRVCPDEVEVPAYDDGDNLDPAHTEPGNGWGNVWAETWAALTRRPRRGGRPTGRRWAPELVIETLAVQIARARDARARIDAEGLIVADAKGNPAPHPALVIERQAQQEVRAAAALIRRRRT